MTKEFTSEELEVMLNHEDLFQRAEAAQQGYKLDVLINDEHWIVRLAAKEKLEAIADGEE